MALNQLLDVQVFLVRPSDFESQIDHGFSIRVSVLWVAAEFEQDLEYIISGMKYGKVSWRVQILIRSYMNSLRTNLQKITDLFLLILLYELPYEK